MASHAQFHLSHVWASNDVAGSPFRGMHDFYEDLAWLQRLLVAQVTANSLQESWVKVAKAPQHPCTRRTDDPTVENSVTSVLHLFFRVRQQFELD